MANNSEMMVDLTLQDGRRVQVSLDAKVLFDVLKATMHVASKAGFVRGWADAVRHLPDGGVVAKIGLNQATGEVIFEIEGVDCPVHRPGDAPARFRLEHPYFREVISLFSSMKFPEAETGHPDETA